jgi:signal transduction histidine kinase/CheY-like chemotaxis protein
MGGSLLIIILVALWNRRLGREIRERKRVELALAEAREAADAANKAKSAFLANMSHELRTPMNAILGYSEMLVEDAEDQGKQEIVPDLKKINQAGTHLLALINDVLDLSKIESGKMKAFAEDIGVGALVDEVVATAQPLTDRNRNQFRVERGDNLGIAHQDLTKLRQSLFNLLSNAAKFTQEGTVTLRVVREQERGVDWLTFAVSDTGIGIPKDKIDRVFEEFSQADDSTTRDYGGTGLGLAISRRFCRLLGGDLTLESQPGEGSTFTIQLPAMLPGSETSETQVEAVPAETEARLETTRQAGSGTTVLVIDDDPEALEIIERFLRKDGISVVTATTGEEGLRIAHEIHPAAITLDVVMPDMDGWSVLRALKAAPHLRDVPVILLTMVDDKTRGYSLGATDYLTKPIDREQLLDVIAGFQVTSESSLVLLVEDDASTRDVMTRILEKAGWEVTEAGNGREALDLLTGIRPAVILLDLMMPVMDGFDFLLEMRTHAEWQDIPVIVLTAKDLTEEDRRILSGRVEQVLEKGAYSRDQLMQHIRKVVAAD